MEESFTSALHSVQNKASSTDCSCRISSSLRQSCFTRKPQKKPPSMEHQLEPCLSDFPPFFNLTLLGSLVEDAFPAQTSWSFIRNMPKEKSMKKLSSSINACISPQWRNKFQLHFSPKHEQAPTYLHLLFKRQKLKKAVIFETPKLGFRHHNMIIAIHFRQLFSTFLFKWSKRHMLGCSNDPNYTLWVKWWLSSLSVLFSTLLVRYLYCK